MAALTALGLGGRCIAAATVIFTDTTAAGSIGATVAIIPALGRFFAYRVGMAIFVAVLITIIYADFVRIANLCALIPALKGITDRCTCGPACIFCTTDRAADGTARKTAGIFCALKAVRIHITCLKAAGTKRCCKDKRNSAR